MQSAVRFHANCYAIDAAAENDVDRDEMYLALGMTTP